MYNKIHLFFFWKIYFLEKKPDRKILKIILISKCKTFIFPNHLTCYVYICYYNKYIYININKYINFRKKS